MFFNECLYNKNVFLAFVCKLMTIFFYNAKAKLEKNIM